MPKELPQSVRDEEYAEARAEDFYAISGVAQPALFLMAAIIVLSRINPELDTAAIYGATAALDKLLHGKFHEIYHQRRDMKTSQSPEPDLVTLVSRT